MDLTTFALVFMIVSMGGVTALTVYCYYRILGGPGKGKRSHGTGAADQIRL